MTAAASPAGANRAGTVHVIGAGLAGLAAAVALADSGREIILYEAGRQAGGRCRSFLDPGLGVRIDNGNHLLLSGNAAALSYIERIGAVATFEPAAPAIPFLDLASGERWTLRPGPGRIPWWLLSARRTVPGARLRDWLDLLRLWRAGPNDTVAAALRTNRPLFRRLWEPLTVAALNTPAAAASAPLLWRVVAETLGRGAAGCRPLLAREGLSESLVDPALAFLARHGCAIRFGAVLRALEFAGTRVGALGFDDHAVALRPHDAVILAVPAAIAARLVPGLVVPDDYAPIVNAHFRYAAPSSLPLFAGVVGGAAEWVFRKREVVSVTVSAADQLVDRPAEALRDLLWRDVARAFGVKPKPAPPARIVKERRATFRATPAQLRRRPPTGTSWNNLRLAGDYVDTGLPATIEGAIRSGFAAAAAIRAPVADMAIRSPAGLPHPAPGTHRGLPARAAMKSGP
ncbi:MAG: hydroxysqualene dehydroxylase HpnE [Thiohalocapsa sp.]